MALLPYNPFRKQLAVMAVGTWVVLLGMTMIVRPEFVKDAGIRNGYLPFFMLLILSLFWSMWSVTGRWKRSCLWSALLTTLLILRVNQLDSLINVVLLLAFGAVWEYYWRMANLTSNPESPTRFESDQDL